MPCQRHHHQSCAPADRMTGVVALHPDEHIVLYEGGPWSGDSDFSAFQRHMHQQIAVATGLQPIHQGRKTCVSCGSIQDLSGDLPCGH